ncbi:MULTISPECIES: DNA cytosine methyltransferase [Vibrio]|nr:MULTISPECIES: DNA cytosine methyltransferase [Vibrio]EJL6600490.1 DNA cytosine methyltransferase [Vibrio cholerae]EKF9120429.1 DNA cytosine methyltransferase [Vibrio cholerae]ELG4777480.1 DNA cytosine methyltransferase [Vibrio cholerae]ELJ8683566.1 DNA cytosine methyltransferase [Vibrio cholerae]ELK8295653.1 DNA cytosine methyltransferase [Vibrio cholerae]
MKKNKYLVDLFSGCGGLSYGFEMAGFESIVGVDIDAPALQTFAHNHPHARALQLDLSEPESIEKIVSEINGRKVEIIVAGPPCQGFSLTGTRNENDKRNKLFYSVFQLAERIKPQFIVIENVPGIANLYQGRARRAILDEFKRLGYSSSEKLMYAPDYGIPQIRKRMFFVGVLGEVEFEFPKPTHNEENYVTCEEAIGDLPSLVLDLGNEQVEYSIEAQSQYQKIMRKDSKLLYNHVGTKHSDLVVSVIRQVPEGGNHKDLPPGVGDSRKFNEAWTRYHSQKPSKTIDTGHRNHFHYKWDRVPTARENARLQSFPDKFHFVGPKTQQYKQIGNAVPPLLGFALGKQIIKMGKY